MGGLGNQLFQFFALRTAALRLSKQAVLDLSWFTDFGRRDFHLARLLDLHSMGIEVKPSSRFLRYPGSRKFKWWMCQRWPAPGKFIERGPYFDARINRESDLRSMVGYFQSWRYFARELNEVSELVRVGLKRHFAAAAEQGASCSSTDVAIHVRLGDYTSPRNRRIYGDVSVEYVRNALTTIRLELGRLPQALIYSDSPKEALETVETSCNGLAEFRVAPSADPMTHLHMMASTHFVVMTNSTLSWWAGLLADRSGSRVFCPTPWTMQPRNDGRDLFLPRWTAVDRC